MATLRLLVFLALLLPCRALQADPLTLDWDFPAAQLVERFRLWRVPGPCPAPPRRGPPLLTTLGTARSATDPSPLPGLACYTVTALVPAVAADALWAACAPEGGTCVFPGTQVVRYGAPDHYVTITSPSPVACSHTVFGDPLPGARKACARTAPTGPLLESGPSNSVQVPATGILAPTEFRLVPE